MNELIAVDFESQTVSARDLHDSLGIEKRFSAWFESNSQGFIEGEDFTSVLSGTVVNNGAHRDLQDYNISVDMAKHICLMSRTEKGKQCRQYLIDLEKAWNTPEQVMARALEFAHQKIEEVKSQNIILIEKNEILSAENDLLSQKNLEWADRAVILALVRAYAHGIGDDFPKAWRDFKKELLYRHGININARITNYLNKTGKRTKPKTLDMLDDSELPAALSTITAMCRENNVDIGEIIQKKAG